MRLVGSLCLLTLVSVVCTNDKQSGKSPASLYQQIQSLLRSRHVTARDDPAGVSPADLGGAVGGPFREHIKLLEDDQLEPVPPEVAELAAHALFKSRLLELPKDGKMARMPADEDDLASFFGFRAPYQQKDDQQEDVEY